MKNRHILSVAVAATLALATAACDADGPDAPGAARGAALAALDVGAVLQPGATVQFFASEFAFAPHDLVAEAGTYRGVLINDGTIEHDIQFANGEKYVAPAGGSIEFDFTVPADGVAFICTIAGHADAGMVGTVDTPASLAAGGVAPAQAAPGGDGAGLDAVEPNPDAPPYQLRDPRTPERGEGDGVTLVAGGAPDGGDLIEVEMVVEEKLMTIAEGYEQMVWTFNGTVPGPVLRTEVGDTVRVHLVNPEAASASHSVDFHASQVAWNDEMRSIAPGEDLVYEFTTDYAGVWMYHCGTDPVLHHIANGMFGMVIVEPAGGLPPIDHEFFFVQNEWYLGPQRELSSYAKANQAAPAPDFVMFNGIAKQYLDNPIEVPTGADVRLYVLDVGPSIDSSFHIVGTIFHDVIKEGVRLTAGNDGNWGSQAVDLAPAQGAVIELRTAEDGLYPIVTHAFNFPGRGAVGLLQAGDGEP
ncbi:MAG: multicopper oxidase domain-containing protein [Ilumatobacter sp.]|nr:multicopper oxidase domain-containing protein [Ilumatobacter sp.]